MRRALVVCGLLGACACSENGGHHGTDGAIGTPAGLRITELCADDDGFLIDELGQTEDWIELSNGGDASIELSRFSLKGGSGKPQALPQGKLGPGQSVVFWADDEPEQGGRHLRFKLSARGETVTLADARGTTVDEVTFPALATNEVYVRIGEAFEKCRYATPGKPNGMRCGPTPPPELPKELDFKSYAWPKVWPPVAQPLAISEAALRPARFVEVANTSTQEVALADFGLRIAPHAPGAPWPGVTDGREIAWPRARLSPGEVMQVPVAPGDVAGAEAEGVMTIVRRSDGATLDRLDFMRWPDGAVLARDLERGATARFCTNASPGVTNPACTVLAERPVGDRLRQLAATRDARALAEGGGTLDEEPVKFIIDMQAGDVVHLLSSKAWALHYGWVRENVYQQPHLDRCDPTEAAVFNTGWYEFSEREYFKVEGRRFLLGTLVSRGGSGLKTVEFAAGDTITGALMSRAFFAVMAKVEDPTTWAVRPQGADQVKAVRTVEGRLPIVDPNAPFRGQTYQPLNAGVTYGILRFVAGRDIATAPLGIGVIMVTDDVPNDIPPVAGLVTEAFQTPLSHVGILARNRGTPNMGLVEARKHPRLAPYFDKLVRLEVTPSGFEVREAEATEANAFWDERRPKGPRVSARLDTSVRALVDLQGRGLADLPVVGAKAAQLADLTAVSSSAVGCAGPVPTPAKAFAIPLVHSQDHLRASGAAALIRSWQKKPEFQADPRVRAAALAEVRQSIIEHPIAPDLLKAVEDAARARFGTQRFRLRSSSNTEDLPGFTGAGLYASVSAAIGDPERTIEDGLHTVWASLWEMRAYDERELALIDHDSAAMGVLVHEAFTKVERANGVAASRNLLDPNRADVYYINAQAGEASVTNPAAGVYSDQILFTPGDNTSLEIRSRSSLTTQPVLTLQEIQRLTCTLSAIHDHFQTRLDPMNKNRWFTMEVEFKFVGDQRRLVIKQARPYSFGVAEIATDCR